MSTFNMPKKKADNSYAVRPHHRFEKIGHRNNTMFKTRNILNILFILLAFSGIILYLITTWHNTAVIIMLVGVIIKFIEAILRLISK